MFAPFLQKTRSKVANITPRGELSVMCNETKGMSIVIVEEGLKEKLKDYRPKIVSDNDRVSVSAKYEDRKIEVVWPFPVMEIYFDHWIGKSKVLSESYEYYEGETVQEIIEDVAGYICKFLSNESRVVEVGKLFKRKELQVLVNGEWASINE